MLIYNDAGLSSNSYFYEGRTDLQSLDLNATSFQYSVVYYDQAQIFMGLSGFDSLSSLNGFLWGWTTTDIVNGTQIFNIKKVEMRNIYFSFLYIGRISTQIN